MTRKTDRAKTFHVLADDGRLTLLDLAARPGAYLFGTDKGLQTLADAGLLQQVDRASTTRTLAWELNRDKVRWLVHVLQEWLYWAPPVPADDTPSTPTPSPGGDDVPSTP